MKAKVGGGYSKIYNVGTILSETDFIATEYPSDFPNKNRQDMQTVL